MVNWLTESEMRAWRNLVVTSYAILARLDRELQTEHGLSLAEYEVMAVLSEPADRSVRMTDLADRLHVSPSGMTRRVDGLVKRGWVERARCPEDRRGSFAVLTDDGFAKLEESAPTHLRGVREHFVDQLTERQLANIAIALEKIELP